MSHYLKTINEAAAQDAPVALKPDLPGISETVVFYPRPGELRAGRGRHAAIVTGTNEDGTLDLVVIYDADDFIGQRHVARRSLDGGMGWEPLPGKSMPKQMLEATADGRLVPVPDNAAQFAGLVEENTKLRADLDALRKSIFGDFDAPTDSIVSILAEFEDKLDAGAPPDVTPAAKRRGRPPKAKTEGQ